MKYDNGSISRIWYHYGAFARKEMDLRPMSERNNFLHDDGSTATIISRMHGGEIMKMSSSSKNNNCLELCDQPMTSKIVSVMKAKTVDELRLLLHLSDKLANVAYQQWSDFPTTLLPSHNSNHNNNNNSSKHNNEQSQHYRPAMFTFSGPAYQGLNPNTCNAAALQYLASKLFIIDPVYGVLRSLQHMYPYRLEMNCKLPLLSIHQEDNKTGIVAAAAASTTTATTANLSSYWKSHITSYLAKELTNIHSGGGGLLSNDQQPQQQQRHRPILVNLASEEYSSCIDKTILPSNAIYCNIIFKHQGKVISVHAKRGRGLLARYLADVNAATLHDISSFDYEGYGCVECANGKMWEVEIPKKNDTTTTTTKEKKVTGDDDDDVGDDNDGVTFVRMIFDRNNCAPSNTKLTKSGVAVVANKKRKATNLDNVRGQK
jgi:cytoplasmic iron level regulating protein YaaA (DUF328/UPF0246 family)